METKRFAELLKQPMLVDDLPVEELRELTARYPFSASLQMLLLKKYQLAEHPAYDEQLAKAAVYAPDRRALYRLVQLRERVVANPEGFEPLPNTGLESVEPVEQDTEKVETEVATKYATEYNSDTVVEPFENAFTDNEATITEAALEEEQYTEETEIEQAEESIVAEPAELEAEDAAVEPTQEIENPEEETEEGPEFIGFVPPVIPVAYWEDEGGIEQETTDSQEAETNTEPEPETDAQEVAPEVITEEETIVVAAIETVVDEPQTIVNEVVQAEQEVTVEAVVEVKPPLETKGKDSFMGWLHRLKHEHPQPESSPSRQQQPELPEVDEKAALDALFGTGTYEATLTMETVEMPEPIQEQATEKPSKEDLMQPDEDANRRMDEQAKKSLSLGEELVTETLARIYEIQKKTAKAIEAYEILKQRHPHKAQEFDRKIQSLREI